MPCNPDAGTISVAKSVDVDEHVIELVTKSYSAVIDRLKKKSATKSFENFRGASEDALQEAAAFTADRVNYILLDEYKYALMRRLDVSDDQRKVIENAIVDTFDKALGLVE